MRLSLLFIFFVPGGRVRRGPSPRHVPAGRAGARAAWRGVTGYLDAALVLALVSCVQTVAATRHHSTHQGGASSKPRNA
jgi:multiple resistance and pH regulation protein F (MrpF/PhaF)